MDYDWGITSLKKIHGLEELEPSAFRTSEPIKTIKSITHPREWDAVKDNLMSILYISKWIIDIERENSHPRYKYTAHYGRIKIGGKNSKIRRIKRKIQGKWVWIYRYRVPKTKKINAEGKREIIIKEFPPGGAPLNSRGESRRGRTPQGRTYRIRREIFQVLLSIGAPGEPNQAVRVLCAPEIYQHDRGELERVSVRMPDFSLAVSGLLAEEIIPSIVDGTLDRHILNYVLPKKGPGSKAAKEGFESIVKNSISRITSDCETNSRKRGLRILSLVGEHRDIIDKLSAKIWRSLLTRLVEMNLLYRLVHEDVAQKIGQQLKINEDSD